MARSIKSVWLFSLLVKLLLSALIPLSADEAYYWVWSQRPQLSYFDHPPFVAWLFYVGDLFAPLGHAVRWPGVVMGHFTLLIFLALIRPYVDFEKARLWLYLALFSPLLGFGSLILTPDIPVLFFWSAALYFAIRALDTKSLYDYTLLGVMLGLGFCSKYHIVLFVPCLLLYLTLEKLWSRVNWRGVLLTLIFGLLFSAPVILWNLQNNFASFEFQLRHGLEKSAYSAEWTLGYVLGQILILFPLIFWAAYRSALSGNIRWALYFGWGPLLFFFLTSFRALVEANWPIIAYPSLFALALLHPSIRRYTQIYIFFWSVLFLVVLSSLFVPTARTLNEKIEEPYVFQEMAEELRDYHPLYGSTYQMSASLWYFRRTPVFKLKDSSRYDFFDSLPEATPSVSKFYLVKTRVSHLPQWILEQQWLSKEVRGLGPNFVLMEISKP